VYGDGSEESWFSVPDVQSDVLSPSGTHVTAFSTHHQSTKENTLRISSPPLLLFKSK